eukprot:6193232-Pleurochrysis_carterae.AAC.4
MRTRSVLRIARLWSEEQSRKSSLFELQLAEQIKMWQSLNVHTRACQRMHTHAHTLARTRPQRGFAPPHASVAARARVAAREHLREEEDSVPLRLELGQQL